MKVQLCIQNQLMYVEHIKNTTLLLWPFLEASLVYKLPILDSPYQWKSQQVRERFHLTCLFVFCSSFPLHSYFVGVSSVGWILTLYTDTWFSFSRALCIIFTGKFSLLTSCWYLMLALCILWKTPFSVQGLRTALLKGPN
jgi:hypothetical protein